MSFYFSQTSKDKLKGVHPDLIRCVEKALSYGIMDFAIVQGVRTKEQQEELFSQGRTKPGKIVTWTKQSKHLRQADDWGHAIDIVPVIKGRLDWNTEENFTTLAALMFRAAMELNALIAWGGFWTEKDRPHFEIITEDLT